MPNKSESKNIFLEAKFINKQKEGKGTHIINFYIRGFIFYI